MPATLTAASAQRAIHTRRTQLRRGALKSVTAEGTRSSGDSEDRSEESEVTAGSVSSEYRPSLSDATIAFTDMATDKCIIQITVSLCFAPKNLHLVYKKSKNLQFLSALFFALRDLLHPQFRPTHYLPTNHYRAERSRTNPGHQPLPLLLTPRDRKY